MDQLSVTLERPLDEVEVAVRAALAAQGFGVLSEIDVAATLRDRLGIERAPLRILGACNPSLVSRALERSLDVALAIPCNVVLYGQGPGRTRVAAADPATLMPGEEFGEIVRDARVRLAAALAALAAEFAR